MRLVLLIRRVVAHLAQSATMSSVPSRVHISPPAILSAAPEDRTSRVRIERHAKDENDEKIGRMIYYRDLRSERRIDREFKEVRSPPGTADERDTTESNDEFRIQKAATISSRAPRRPDLDARYRSLVVVASVLRVSIDYWMSRCLPLPLRRDVGRMTALLQEQPDTRKNRMIGGEATRNGSTCFTAEDLSQRCRSTRESEIP